MAGGLRHGLRQRAKDRVDWTGPAIWRRVGELEQAIWSGERKRKRAGEWSLSDDM